MTDQPLPPRRVAMTLPVDACTGWGVYGLNVALQSLARGVMPVLLKAPHWTSLSPFHGGILAAAGPTHQQVTQAMAERAGQTLALNCPLVIAFGNQFQGPTLPCAVEGTRNVGIVVSECSKLTPQAVEVGKRLDHIVTGSAWNAHILRRHGLHGVAVVTQGIDPALFFPGPRSGLWKNHFVIFSGGKLEYRKGQDIVIAAVRAFQRRHPDAILALAWHSAWNELMEEIPSASLVEGAPAIGPNGQIDFSAWLHRNDVHGFLDLGIPFNWQVGTLLREADVALLPSRAEGATNFVAMECLASGVPTILSANTGHLDIISDDICYPLREQGPVRPTPRSPDVEGWGESSVDEIMDTLERIYRDRTDARRRAAAAVQAMRRISWENQVGQLLQELA
jgi:glycosyltransferase involved in cell wall biosynthesis